MIISLTIIIAFLSVFVLLPSKHELEAEKVNEEKTMMQSKILIAYFSHWGHSKEFAKLIQKITGGDLFEITTDHYYPIEHDPCSQQAHQEQLTDYRPHLTGHVKNINQYDVVFIGHPIWWYREPMIIRSFWEEYDFSGKTIVPFCTSGDVDIKNTEEDAKKFLPASKIAPGLRLSSYSISSNEAQVKQWISSLHIL